MGQMLAGVASRTEQSAYRHSRCTELLREKESVEESTKRQLDLTHRQARRAARIVQNLLESLAPRLRKRGHSISTVLSSYFAASRTLPPPQ